MLKMIKERRVSFVWLSPPCYGHSAAQNGRVGGPLRTRSQPEGVDPTLPIVQITNQLWFTALHIFQACCDVGMDVVIEHPLTSFAWRMEETINILNMPNISKPRFDACMYPEVRKPRMLKPTALINNTVWVSAACLSCDGNHKHDKHLRGIRATEAAHFSPSSSSVPN